MPDLTLDINPSGRLSRQILEGVQDRILMSKAKTQKMRDAWTKAEEAALAYLPEREIDATRRAVREGGKPQYTTIQIPYSYAVMMAAHTYWSTVFMSRAPILQYTGRHGEGEQQTQAVEALIDYQVRTGEMLPVFYIWLNDVAKYGYSVVGEFWDEETIHTSEIIEREDLLLGVLKTGKMKKVKVTREGVGYIGNKIYNVRPYDFYTDPRVALVEFQKGEFCAVWKRIGWNEILEKKAEGEFVNTEFVRSVQTSFARDPGSPQVELPEQGGFSITDGKPPNAAGTVGIFECHIKLVPSEWKLGKSDRPEKWVFTVTDDYRVVLSARPHGAYHARFPFTVLPLEPEGYTLNPRGIPKILEPIQNTLDWLINSHFYNVRKVLNDMFIVDPSRVVTKDLDYPGPGGYIRLRPSAYGQDVRSVITQLPVTDVTQNHIRDMQMMLGIGERTLGINDQMLGVLNAGGSSRKTATEVRTSSTFGINRLKVSGEWFSAVGWAPMSQRFVQNSQQYYELDRAFRVVGDLAQGAGPEFMQVTPESIQGFYDFVPVDGTLPVDRFAQANLWREMLLQFRQLPELQARYDIGRIFEWVAQLAGLKNIRQFRIDIQPDAQLAAQAQQGNIVPLGGNDPTVVPEPGQVGGMGTTG